MALFTRARGDHGAPGDRYRLVLDAALRVSDIAASSHPLPEALDAMVGEAIALMEAEQGSIMLRHDDGRHLVLVAARGLPAEATAARRLAIGESVAGRVLATGRPLLLNDIDEDAFVNYVVKARPPRSSVVVPLRVKGDPIGVLNLAISQEAPPFTDEDLRVAQMFADQAAALIHIARLHDQAEQRSSDLGALVESSKGLIGSLDVSVLLHQALEGGARLMGSRDGFACLFDPDTGAIGKGVFRGIDKSAIAGLVDGPEVRAAAESGEFVAIERPGADPLVAVGIHTSRGTRGAIVVVAARPDLIHERSHLVRAFAHQAGLAIGSAELHSLVDRKETELESITHSIANPIVLVDARDRIVMVNAAAEQLFGISAQFCAGLPVDGALGHSAIERVLTGRGAMESEVTAGDPPRVFKVRVTEVSAPGGVMGRVMIMDDVSTERAIMQTQRDFVAMIGHELRTPLTIIKGFARPLLRRADHGDVEEIKEGFAIIDARADQLGRLIEDLLYVSGIEARETSVDISAIEIGPLVASVAENVGRDHEGRELILDVPEGLRWACDVAKAGIVLRHLVDNALKYSEAPHPVTIRAREEDDELRFDVIDRGVGIVSSDLPHVFDRFRQVDSSSTREHGGMGVGLYLCAQLVRLHGGRIWADSIWGKGSTFSFTLPRRAPAAAVGRIVGEGGLGRRRGA